MNRDNCNVEAAASHFIPSSDEAELRLRVRRKGNSGAPVLLVHGAGLASSSFDIPHASWMDSCVAAGHTAYALDVRGYGQSHSTVMHSASVPYARATDAIKDIDDAIGWISQRHKGVRPALVGVSWGSVTTGLYASGIGVEKISCLNLIAPIFAERNQNWIDLLADPTNQSQLNPNFGSFRRTTAAGVRERWDEEIPDGSDWRAADTFESLMASIMADDSESGNFDPPQFRAPNGTFVDLWHCFNGMSLYDPAHISAPVLLVRGSQDTTSTRSDSLALFDRLTTEKRHYTEIANASHFLIAERKAPQLFDCVSTFINQSG